MKRMKVFLAFVLALSMLLSHIPFSYAEDKSTSLEGNNELPANYVDNSNDGLYNLLSSLSEEAPSAKSMRAMATSTAKVDIVFAIDSTGSMSPYISNVKNNIAAFATYLSDLGATLRVGVVEYKDIAEDGLDSTKVHTANYSPWMNLTAFVDTLTKISVYGGGDYPETPIDALGYLTDELTMLWSSDAYKFAVVLTDASYKVNNTHGYSSLTEMAEALSTRGICTSVITTTSNQSTYSELTSMTGGIWGNIYSYNFASVLEELANTVMGATARSKKAIYVLPGYLGSELYDGADGTSGGKRLWFPENIFDLDTILHQDNLRKFYQDDYGNGTQLHVDYNRDDCGVLDTYKSLMKRLTEDFGEKYDVRFFPYNWLEDLNDSTKKLENDINKNGYSKVVFVTHSTGGLLASSYISKSDENKLKVLKAILIAPPLFGTYASLLPIERGDSRKTGNFFSSAFWIDALTSNSWIRGWAKNSPTTYQLLPSEEYLQYLPLQDKGGWGDGERTITSIDEFYSVLNQSDNINPNLTNGTNRSHKYFRETTLKADVIEQWSLASLMEVDTLLIGTPFGHLTTSVAVYNEPVIGTNRKLKDIQYNKNGDGTIQWFSARGQKRGQTAPLRSDFSFTSDHNGLVSDINVLNTVSSEICSLDDSYKVTRSILSNSLGTLSDSTGMNDYIKIYYSSTQAITATIYNRENEMVAQVVGENYEGFDGDDFIYHSFAYNESESEALIYMPNQGYKLVFSYGDEAAVDITFSSDISTLVSDGWKDVSINFSADTTSENGIILVLDGTNEAILSENISDKVDGDMTMHFTDWDLQDEIKLNLNETKTVNISGSQATEVAPLLNWFSSDDSIVSVTSGDAITATGYGKATISATDGNKSSVCLITVVQNATSVSLPDVDMVIGERTLIRPEFTPIDTTERDMVYTMSKDGIVEINEYGVIHALAEGTVTITGTTTYGVQDTFTVNVRDDTVYSVQSIEISPSTASIAIGSNVILRPVIKPENATNKNVNWFVDDEEVCSISSTADEAVITGLKEGSTTVTVVSVDGGYTAEATITVTKVHNVSIDATASTGGTVSGGGTYASGTVVTLIAKPNSSYAFDGWYEGDSKVMGAGATYTFTAVANRTLEARFRYIYSGGGGYTSSEAATLIPKEVTFNKAAPKDITVTLSQGSYSFREIKNGDYTLIRDEEYSADGNTYTIKSDYLSTLNDGKTTLVFKMSDGNNPTLTITINKENLMSIDNTIMLNGKTTNLKPNTDGSITLTDSDISGLSTPVLLTLPIMDGSNSHVGILKKGTQNIIIPFSLYQDGAITMLVSEPGTYGAINNSKTFNDIRGHWASETIDFIASRELFYGNGDKFDPNGGMTRAMFVTVLSRLDGADLLGYKTTAFTDVSLDSWFGKAIAWAADKGIVSGYGSGLFGPNDLITREQMAVIFNNYMKYKGIALKKDDYMPFEDDDKVSSWAKDAVSDMKRCKLILGDGNNVFSPHEPANRASAAQIFRNFIESYIMQ